MLEMAVLGKLLTTESGLAGSYAGGKVAKTILEKLVIDKAEDYILRFGITCLTGAAGVASAEFVMKQVSDVIGLVEWAHKTMAEGGLSEEEIEKILQEESDKNQD